MIEKSFWIMLPMRLQNKVRVWIPLKKVKMHYDVTKERMKAYTALLSSFMLMDHPVNKVGEFNEL